MPKVIYISPVAFLRRMAAIAWSAISDPFRTIVIGLSSGRRVGSKDRQSQLTASKRTEFTWTYRAAMAQYRAAVTKVNGRVEQLTAVERNKLRRICLVAMAKYRSLRATTPLARIHASIVWRQLREIKHFLNSHSTGQPKSRRYQSPAGEYSRQSDT